MPQENRPAPRGVGRGYSGYDRHGNYDPYGDLLRFREADEASSWAGLARAEPATAEAAIADLAIADLAMVELAMELAMAEAAMADPTMAELAMADPAIAEAAEAASREASRDAAPKTAALLPQAPAWTAPAALILGPLLGVLAGRIPGSGFGPASTSGPASGLAFTVAVVLAAMLAAAAVPRRTLWWVVPAAPPAVWLTSVAAALTLDPSGDQAAADSRMTALTRATVHAVPVMTAAVTAALCVVLAGHVLAPADRAPRADRRGPSHA